MKLQYLGHAAFRIISDMGTTIVTDPYDGKMTGFEMAPVRTDVVTVSHHHGDHDCMNSILGNPAVVDEEIACAADDIAVASYSTFHDEDKGAKRGTNLVFTFLVDGIKVVHMGDIGCRDENIVEKIKFCDVLLLPVGGTFTVDADGAKWYVDEVKPKIVIPMHYKSEEHSFDIDGVDEFLSLFDEAAVTRSVSDTLTLYDVPLNDEPRIIVLQRYQD